MTYEDGVIPPRTHVKHYYGDTVRVLFVIGALLLVLGETTGAQLPLSAMGAIASAVILAVAAGITNPEQRWIHYVNEVIAILGTLLFASSAISNWQKGAGFFNPSYFFTEVITLLSLLALYFATKTIRGILLRSPSR